MFIPLIIFLTSATFVTPTVLSQSETYTPLVKNPESLELYVEEYFTNTPILADIAQCESRMRHFDKNGEILRGEVDSDDVGIMQINTRYHAERAGELQINLYSLRGNLKYAEYLYEKEGVRPWRASRACWDKIAAR